ncbi:cycloheximide resistance [Purpureocillium lavendulum]|uniref:Cycloheximide resistance n=1 Tax=Purpureocillium lavendulum TaxID=1247861 RepID=A0AB34G6C2_9HYPO|nr:cycloheximide resistance [Purpureocillium lavendulum]
MSKRTVFTSITPLPAGISRATALAFLHNHLEMIDLNPLIIRRERIAPPPHCPAEERACVWYQLTDKVSYLPGGLAASDVDYTCAFHDLPAGLQTHCYAPLGLDIRDRWSVGGSLPGEPREPVELGIGAPASGLYLREDVDMRCNIVMAAFVKKTLKKSHGALVVRLAEKAKFMKEEADRNVRPPQRIAIPRRLSFQGELSPTLEKGPALPRPELEEQHYLVRHQTRIGNGDLMKPLPRAPIELGDTGFDPRRRRSELE